MISLRRKPKDHRHLVDFDSFEGKYPTNQNSVELNRPKKPIDIEEKSRTQSFPKPIIHVSKRNVVPAIKTNLSKSSNLSYITTVLSPTKAQSHKTNTSQSNNYYAITSSKASFIRTTIAFEKSLRNFVWFLNVVGFCMIVYIIGTRTGLFLIVEKKANAVIKILIELQTPQITTPEISTSQ